MPIELNFLQSDKEFLLNCRVDTVSRMIDEELLQYLSKREQITTDRYKKRQKSKLKMIGKRDEFLLFHNNTKKFALVRFLRCI